MASSSAYPPFPQPSRKRPSVGWFVLGAGLLLLALVVFALALFLTLRPLLHEDAVVAADGSVTQVSLPPSEERALFIRDEEPASCLIVDGAGSPVALRPVGGDYSTGDWAARYRFDTRDGRLTVRCASDVPDASVRIGPLPSTARLAVGIGTALGVPFLLGVSGVAVLVVTTVRWSRVTP